MDKRETPSATELLKDLSAEGLVELYPVYTLEELRKERGALDIDTNSSDSSSYPSS